jgi:hypothetical protein
MRLLKNLASLIELLAKQLEVEGSSCVTRLLVCEVELAPTKERGHQVEELEHYLDSSSF